MSIIEQAKYELELADFGPDSEVIIEILELFFDTWDSGGAVHAVAPILQRLIAGKPLSPLTGADDEWVIHDFSDRCYAQNIRCGTVFKNRDGKAYNIASHDFCEKLQSQLEAIRKQTELAKNIAGVFSKMNPKGDKFEEGMKAMARQIFLAFYPTTADGESRNG